MSRSKNYMQPSDLKTILHSKRANLYYLEYCRILVNGGRVEYVTDRGKESLYFNIPIANTTSLILGTGTSITQAAVRDLSKAGVMIGFCGGLGTPLFAGTEMAFLSPQSEYRPTEYLQGWCQFWFDDQKRLAAAKVLQLTRLEIIEALWVKHDWTIDVSQLKATLDQYRAEMSAAKDSQNLLLSEGRLTRKLYSFANSATIEDDFKRNQGGDSKDPANRFLDHGNYLAYGLGATACWVLGLPHGLAILHGKTRRGGLVFDAADIIKDAIVLPQAFISALNGDSERAFRETLTMQFNRFEALDQMIEVLQKIAQSLFTEEEDS